MKPTAQTDKAVKAYVEARRDGHSVAEAREVAKAFGDKTFANLSVLDLIEWEATNPAFGNRKQRRASKVRAKREK